jgi:hypothetical protein
MMASCLCLAVDFMKCMVLNKNGNVLKQDKSVIGYEANGNPHYIDSRYRNQFSYKWPSTFNKNGNVVESVQKSEVSSILPPPNLESIEIKTSKDMLSFATIKFKCYGLAQLEYLAPFFLTPRINVFVEIGWNLFNINSLIDLSSKNECWSIIQSPQKIMDKWYQSYGNYGGITGIVTKYNFSTQDGTIYDCNVELTFSTSIICWYACGKQCKYHNRFKDRFQWQKNTNRNKRIYRIKNVFENRFT